MGVSGNGGVSYQIPSGSGGGVTQIIAGTNITVSPGGGTGVVTVNSTGGGSGITRSISTISTATSAGATALTDYVYLCSGTTTLTLPTAVGNTNLYTVKKTDSSNTTTIATTSAQTIDGAATLSLTVQYQSYTLVSNNSNWSIVA